jgi:hypothetical protein
MKYMDDAIITGLFTLLGTALGFGLVKLSDMLKERKTKEIDITLFIFNLSVLHAPIVAIKSEVENLEPIKTSQDLNKINNILKISDVKKEIAQLEIFFEKIILSKVVSVDVYIGFKRLVKQINAITYFIETRNEMKTFDDAKPFLIKNLSETSQNIEDIIKKVDKF